jgi:hypothetical protein
MFKFSCFSSVVKLYIIIINNQLVGIIAFIAYVTFVAFVKDLFSCSGALLIFNWLFALDLALVLTLPTWFGCCKNSCKPA